MRILAAATLIGLLVISQSTQAQDKAPPANPPKASASKPSADQESTEAADASRKKAEALAEARQRRMDKLSRSICTGC